MVNGPASAHRLELHATTKVIVPFSLTYHSTTAFTVIVSVKTNHTTAWMSNHDFKMTITKITSDIPSLARSMRAKMVLLALTNRMTHWPLSSHKLQW